MPKNSKAARKIILTAHKYIKENRRKPPRTVSHILSNGKCWNILRSAVQQRNMRQ